MENLINLTHLIFCAQYNQPFSNSLEKLTNLTHLILGYIFNQLLSNSLEKLENLTHLIVGYNEKINLPYNIKILTLDCNNFYLIENLSNGIEEINYNFDLKKLPNSIKKIRFVEKSNYNNLIKIPEGSKIIN